MRYEHLLHVLRASAAISDEKSFVLIGSQAVLLLLDSPPEAALRSIEIDLYPANAPHKAALIDGSIGALSAFHETFGYHADGVGPETAVLPTDWMTRAKFSYFGEITAICPSLADLVLSKAAAGREKDAEFVRSLLQAGSVSFTDVDRLIDTLDVDTARKSSIRHWMQRRQAEALAP
jgi:hypothetical protein